MKVIKCSWALALVSVAACTTPYQRMGLLGGVKAMQVGQTDYVITVKVNVLDAVKKMDYALLKASEIGRYSNFTHFVMLEEGAAEAPLPAVVRTRTGACVANRAMSGDAWELLSTNLPSLSLPVQNAPLPNNGNLAGVATAAERNGANACPSLENVWHAVSDVLGAPADMYQLNLRVGFIDTSGVAINTADLSMHVCSVGTTYDRLMAMYVGEPAAAISAQAAAQ